MLTALPPATSRPSLGRSLAVRGLDLFVTPPVALGPLFEHEPLLAGVTTVSEPFCGKGNLVVAMRERGLTVFASDIAIVATRFDGARLSDHDRAAAGCDVLISGRPMNGYRIDRRRAAVLSAPHDERYDWAYLFGAACPQRRAAAGLVIPAANVAASHRYRPQGGGR